MPELLAVCCEVLRVTQVHVGPRFDILAKVMSRCKCAPHEITG